MIQMFSNIFGAVATLFGAVQRGANALDSIAKWAEGEAQTFEESEALQRQARIRELNVELKKVA